MDIETKIYINNDLDIVMARMQAREVAKKMGFSTADQARISLAASELARVLTWVTHEPGEIIISRTSKSDHHGLQIVCLVQREYLPVEDGSNGEVATSVPGRSIVGARQLVDESTVEEQNSEQARITLIKWLK